jgi:hypothetical protein
LQMEFNSAFKGLNFFPLWFPFRLCWKLRIPSQKCIWKHKPKYVI